MPDLNSSPTPADGVRSHLRSVLRELTTANIRHCILRNHQALTDGLDYENTDLDLLIEVDALPRAHAVLYRNGYIDAGRSTVTAHRDYVTYLASAASTISIDLHLADPSWNDVAYFSGELLLDETVLRNGIAIPAETHEALLLALHAILDKKALKPVYADAIRNSSVEAAATMQLLVPFFGSSQATRITRLLRSGDTENLMQSRWRLILALLGFNPANWYRMSGCVVRSRWRSLIRRLLPAGMVVGLVGPDGSGKSTARELLETRLRGCGISFRSIYMGRWQNQILPLAGGSRRWGSAAVSPTSAGETEPASADPSVLRGRSVYRVVRETIYLVDMALRYLFRILPARYRVHVVISERYALDLAIDPSSTPWTKFVLKHLYPIPDFCVYLRGNARDLWARKQEQSLGEIQRQLSRLDEWRRPYRLHTVQAKTLSDLESALVGPVVLRAMQRL